MQGSPSFSRAKKQAVVALTMLLAMLPLMAAGCVTVRPEEKEYLAQPAMSWGGEGIAEQHEHHIIENREGSTGGSGTTGGGCGCN